MIMDRKELIEHLNKYNIIMIALEQRTNKPLWKGWHLFNNKGAYKKILKEPDNTNIGMVLRYPWCALNISSDFLENIEVSKKYQTYFKNNPLPTTPTVTLAIHENDFALRNLHTIGSFIFKSTPKIHNFDYQRGLSIYDENRYIVVYGKHVSGFSYIQHNFDKFENCAEFPGIDL